MSRQISHVENVWGMWNCMVQAAVRGPPGLSVIGLQIGYVFQSENTRSNPNACGSFRRMDETLGDLGEFELIRRLVGPTRVAADAPAAGQLVLGTGDDAAVIRPRSGHDLVVTTDTFVEGAHFRRDWIGAAQLGARLAEANLSDLAAMAAEPRWALVSLGARREHAVEDLVAIQRGIATALARQGAVIAGGNLTAVSGDEWLTLTLMGETFAGKAWTRAGARAGHLIAVTGSPGRSGAMVALARRDAAALSDSRWAGLAAAWRSPRARVELARALGETGWISAAIDVSDGLGSDLARLCEASGAGARLAGEALPRDVELEDAARALGVPLDELRFGASDDYELVLTVDPAGREACLLIAAQLDIPLTFVGVISSGSGVSLEDSAGHARPLVSDGYDHFRPGRA